MSLAVFERSDVTAKYWSDLDKMQSGMPAQPAPPQPAKPVVPVRALMALGACVLTLFGCTTRSQHDFYQARDAYVACAKEKGAPEPKCAIDISQEGDDLSWLDFIEWPTEKPPAMITIDDRALTLTGNWADFDIVKLRAFKPWNKKGK